MHRIKQIDEIDPNPGDEADWSYAVSVDNGIGYNYKFNDAYSNDVDDITKDVTHSFDIYTDYTTTPEFTIKVWERDLYIPYIDGPDLADVSAYNGDGIDDNIDEDDDDECDERGAILHCRYDMINNKIIEIDDIDDETDPPWLITSGTGDGGTGNTNDAKVWFKVTDTYSKPVASINGPDTGKIGESIQFNGGVTGGLSPFSWNWDFGGGESSNVQNPTHTYHGSGTFTVGLTVTDKFGQSSSSNHDIYIEPDEDIPSIPEISGRSKIQIPGVWVNYSAISTDINGDHIYYEICKDGWTCNTSEALPPGEPFVASFNFIQSGEYVIKARASDDTITWTEWATMPVTAPKARPYLNPILQDLVLKLFERTIFFKYFSFFLSI
jgi:hypothetical protein